MATHVPGKVSVVNSSHVRPGVVCQVTTIRIRHFKAVRDSGPIKLGPLTAFVGYNGTGKSSVLEACELFQVGIVVAHRGS